jgi:hypothetical protein
MARSPRPATRWQSSRSIGAGRSGPWSPRPNRYFAGEEPWALKKTDPARMDTVLYVTAEVVRQVAILAQPVDAGIGRQAARSAGRREDAATSPRSAKRAAWCRARAAEAPSRSSRAMSSRRRRGRLMLIDTHCHLDFPDFAEELDEIVARAEAAGVGRMVTISTRVRASTACSRSPKISSVFARSARIRTMRDEELDITAEIWSRCRKHPKVVAIGEAGLDYFYDKTRARRRRGLRTHIAAARETSCRWSSIAAAPMTTWRDPDARRWGRAPSPSILHCFTGGESWRMTGVELGCTSPSPAS